MTAQRCEVTELLVDQCGGECCRPDLADITPGPEAVPGSRRGAIYEAVCPACRQAIHRGMVIAKTDDGWLHEGCCYNDARELRIEGTS